jgi:hypothetical protein
MRRITTVAIALMLTAVLTAGCTAVTSGFLSGSSAGAALSAGSGRLVVNVTDPPPPDMDHVWVDIANLEIHRDEGPWETVAVEMEPFDLKALEGIEAFLASQIVEAGRYTQIRLDVETVTIVVGEEEHDAKVPSGKIKLVGTFEVAEGETTEITLDFVGKESVHVTGNGQYIFKPVIKLLLPKGQDKPEKPEKLEATLEATDDAAAEVSEAQAHSDEESVHLVTTGTEGDGDEARIVVELPEGTKLGDIESISWWEYNVAGYPPHVDIKVDTDDDGTVEDALVLEYAYNTEAHAAEAPMPYGALTGAWYQTFGDDGNGPAIIDDTANAWLSSGPPGPLGDASFIYGTLSDWKAGTVDPSVDGDTAVISVEIEVDNWVVNSEAYVDDIEIVIDGVTYVVEF